LIPYGLHVQKVCRALIFMAINSVSEDYAFFSLDALFFLALCK